MQALFEESQQKQEQSRQNFEARFKQFATKSTQDAKALKERIRELEDENEALEKKLVEPEDER